MKLRDFNPTKIWYRSAADPVGSDHDYPKFFADWELGEFAHTFCGNATGDHAHNGDNWLDLNGEVTAREVNVSDGTIDNGYTLQIIETWIWDGKGRCLDLERNKVFELEARK